MCLYVYLEFAVDNNIYLILSEATKRVLDTYFGPKEYLVLTQKYKYALGICTLALIVLVIIPEY